MNDLNQRPPRSRRWMKSVAILAAVFGVATLFSGGSVLFGPPQARTSAGNYIPFVVWFNVLAGVLYIIAATAIWLDRGWALSLAWFIALATAMTALVFGYQVFQGTSFEIRTVGALTLRFGFWAAIALALGWTRRKS